MEVSFFSSLYILDVMEGDRRAAHRARRMNENIHPQWMRGGDNLEKLPGK
jgi:hypothetical protein